MKRDIRERNTLVQSNMGLVHACANRFRGRGVEYEDLVQSGCIGLLKAANGFDETKGFMFSTYAVPAIIGEIKRIFRDGGAVKVGRSDKEKARYLMKIRDELANEMGREPSISELAEKTGCDMFIAGCEMVQSERREKEWRKLISDIRSVTTSSLGCISPI